MGPGRIAPAPGGGQEPNLTPERQQIDIAGALPELRREPAATLPSAADVRTREILGIPIAMTDYERAMDVMDAMVARRERGYVCAVAVHAVMVAQSDPEMRAALLRSTLTVPAARPESV